MNKIILNEKEFNFNALTPKNSELFEKEETKIKNLAKDMQQEPRASVAIKKICAGIEDSLNNLLGENAAAEIFGEEIDLVSAVEVWAELSKQVVDNAAAAKSDLLSRI